MNSGARVGSSRWFTEFGDLVDLTQAGWLIDEGKNNSRDDQTWRAPDSDIRSIAKLDVVDIGGVRAGEVLNRDEVRGLKRLGMVGVSCGKKLAGQRQQAKIAAMDCGGATGIACLPTSLGYLH